jgi:acyl-coenzyme A synthetase/AMP-(fatty) acid ligase
MFENHFDEGFKGSSNILSDEHSSIRYDELGRLFSVFDQKLASLGGTGINCFSLSMKNELVDLVLLLWLLYRNKSFVVSQATKAQGVTFPPNCNVKIERPAVVPKDAFSAALSVSFSARKEAIPLELVQPAAYFRTSGTTGAPKYAKHTLANLLANSANAKISLQLDAGDRVLVPVPLHHMYGFGAALIPSVLAGASIRIIHNANILKFFDADRTFSPNIVFITPLLSQMIIQSRRKAKHYRKSVVAGDRLKAEIFREYELKFGPLVNLYGSTEMGVMALSDERDPVEVRAKGVVRQLDNVTISGSHRLASYSEDRFLVRCVHRFGFECYVDEYGRKVESTVPGDKGFDTGDIGCWIDSKKFTVIGRLNNSVNRNGFLVTYADIESRIEEASGVIEKVIVKATQEETLKGRKIIAFCQTKSEISSEDIRLHCLRNLPNFLVPDEVRIVTDFPRTTSGKVDRNALEV